MDIQEEWNSLSTEFDSSSANYNTDQEILKKESNGVYETLVKHLSYKLMWAGSFSLLLLILALYTSGALQILLIAAFAAFLFGALVMAVKMRTLPRGSDYDNVSRQVLTERIKLINKVLNFERYWGYVFIPIAAPTGFIASKLLRHNDFSVVFSQDNWLFSLSLCLVLAIGGIYLAIIMNKLAFGNYLDNLNAKVKQLAE